MKKEIKFILNKNGSAYVLPHSPNEGLCVNVMKSLWELDDIPKDLTLIISTKPLKEGYWVISDTHIRACFSIFLTDGSVRETCAGITYRFIVNTLGDVHEFYVAVDA